MRAIVGNEHKFINNDPSPSSAITLRRGSPNAIPKAMDEQSPKVLTRKLPSLGLSAFHSSVVAPAELTTSASPASATMVCRQSNRFIWCYLPAYSTINAGSPELGDRPFDRAQDWPVAATFPLPAYCSHPFQMTVTGLLRPISVPKLLLSAAAPPAVLSLQSIPALV